MCGFAGVLSTNGLPTVDLGINAARMAEKLRHRGPDSQGVWADESAGIALAHRRLAVLDLSPAGHQPMESSSGRFVLAFNGEIYNHLDMRQALEQSAGNAWAWNGHSDTETMLAGFEQWGIEKTLNAATGMFAIAVWDRNERQLLLARDRMGEKPLYYGWCSDAFLFASELKAFKTYPGFKPQINRDALVEYLRFSYVPSPLSIYSNFFKLEPGVMAVVNLDAPNHGPETPPRAPQSSTGFQLHRWWSLPEVVAQARYSPVVNETEALNLLEAGLRTATRQQSIADVPLGAFLSGGIDSSLATALMQAESSKPVRTFTVGFDEADHNEAAHAATVARHLGTDHLEIRVAAKDALDLVPALPEIYDEPFADSSQIPTAIVCREARKHVTVAVSGDAGDESFGGYNRHVMAPAVWRKAKALPGPLRRAGARLALGASSDYWNQVAGAMGIGVTAPGDKVHKVAAGLSQAEDFTGFYQSLVSTWQRPEELVREAVLGQKPRFELTGGEAGLAEWMMLSDSMSYLPDDILCKVDRASMAFSLETRAPFLDHHVVELAWRLPINMKIRDGKGKWILRQLLRKFLPPEAFERPKQGFSIPLAEWLRGPLRDWAEPLLARKRLEDEGLFNPEPVRAAWKTHLAGRDGQQHRLWAVLMFQAWLEAQ